jgi:outer membrane protein assembly factor BamE (lipoprotein component of BamABCDE complex)
MTKQQVINIMGQPSDRQISGNRETWYYQRRGDYTYFSARAWIDFVDGRVTGMRTDN